MENNNEAYTVCFASTDTYIMRIITLARQEQTNDVLFVKKIRKKHPKLTEPTQWDIHKYANFGESCQFGTGVHPEIGRGQHTASVTKVQKYVDVKNTL